MLINSSVLNTVLFVQGSNGRMEGLDANGDISLSYDRSQYFCSNISSYKVDTKIFFCGTIFGNLSFNKQYLKFRDIYDASLNGIVEAQADIHPAFAFSYKTIFNLLFIRDAFYILIPFIFRVLISAFLFLLGYSHFLHFWNKSSGGAFTRFLQV